MRALCFGFAAPATGLSNTEPRLLDTAGVHFLPPEANTTNTPSTASTAFGDDVVVGFCSLFYVFK